MPSIETALKKGAVVVAVLATIALAAKLVPQIQPARDFLLK